MPWTTPTLSATQLPYVSFGTTTTVGECFATYVEPYLPSHDVVQHWHQLLLDYVAQPQAILFIRRYASYAKKQRNTLRRGFLTLDPTGFGYAYCDNSIAQLIFAQVLAGRRPSLAELNVAIADRSFPVSTILSRLERQQLTFGLAASPQLGRRGWKLSHLYPVNSGYSFNYENICQHLFPRGDYAWWGTPDQVYRLGNVISPDDRKKMVAHFLRTVHPANYFLSPSRRHQTGADVGENPVLLAYMRKQFEKRYGTILAELHTLFQAPTLNTWPSVIACTPLHLTVQAKAKSRKTTASKSPTASGNTPSHIAITPRRIPITFKPASEDAFKAGLLVRRKATITLTRKDGSTFSKEWDAAGFKATSKLRGNLLGHSALRPAARVAENVVAIYVTLAH